MFLHVLLILEVCNFTKIREKGGSGVILSYQFMVIFIAGHYLFPLFHIFASANDNYLMTRKSKPVESRIIREITPLSEKDCFYIADRHKTEFTYPIHCHKEFELNFVENAAGVRRIVGDSVETVKIMTWF